jgi:GntR family transcriptional repressor for pyruvate dehydrogenase complex
MVKIKPVARNSLVDAVVEQIRGLIEQGQLTAGDRLPSESELVGKLGVSRTVLREAVSRLETMGLVTVQRGRGMFVGDPRSLSSCVQMVRSAMAISPREMAQFAEFRSAIECYCARRAAERATPADLAELATLLEQIDQPGQDYLEAVGYDFKFHLKLVDITGNALMRNVMEVIQQFVLAGMVQTTPQPRNHERSQQLHGDILQAVKAGDPDQAEKAMQRHMESVALALASRTQTPPAPPAPESEAPDSQ